MRFRMAVFQLVGDASPRRLEARAFLFAFAVFGFLTVVAGAAPHAEAGAQVVAADDVASLASTTMVLGLVRDRQGQSEEAESLLRKAVSISESTDYLSERWEYYLSLAKFLFSQGRANEAQEWLVKMRGIIALYGASSPLVAYAERQLAAAARPT